MEKVIEKEKKLQIVKIEKTTKIMKAFSTAALTSAVIGVVALFISNESHVNKDIVDLCSYLTKAGVISTIGCNVVAFTHMIVCLINLWKYKKFEKMEEEKTL